MSRFIEHGNFIIRYENISYITKIPDNKLMVTMIDNSKFTMEFDNDYLCEKAFSLISCDLDSITLDYWKSALVKQIYFLRDSIDSIQSDSINPILKEIKLIKKHLKSK